MAAENAKHDENKLYALLAVNAAGETRMLKVDASDQLLVAVGALSSADDSITTVPAALSRKTYSAATNFTTAASATDVFTIGGSATKTIHVTRIFINGIQTTTGIADFVLIKRSTANTGGTSFAVTTVPHDSTNAAATAAILGYTANPAALGTSLSAVRRGKTVIPAGSGTTSPGLEWNFEDNRGQGLILRGTSEFLCVNLSGVTLSGNFLIIGCEWYEV